jgi:hypothetical protein
VAATGAIYVQSMLHLLLRWTEPEQQPYFALAIESWLALGVAGALYLAANNLSVIAFGENKLAAGFDRSIDAAGTVGGDLLGLTGAVLTDIAPSLLSEAATVAPQVATQTVDVLLIAL